jgi:predicted HD superfamily hydrolase involved in NAD metabolism
VCATLNQDHRYAHVVRVARCAELLAQRHGVATDKARLAGMLHDLARLYSGAQLIEACRVRQMSIGAFEERNPIVLHAPLGAALAREDFDVEDEAVFSAIAKHTVADAVMSPLDCVVYLADSLEPGRVFPERAALWELATRDLGAAMHETIKHSLVYLERKGFEPAPQTIAAAAAFRATQGVGP